MAMLATICGGRGQSVKHQKRKAAVGPFRLCSRALCPILHVGQSFRLPIQHIRREKLLPYPAFLLHLEIAAVDL